MSKELTKKQPLDMSFSSERISANDIVMPKLWLIQPTSELANSGDAKLGDLADSLTGEVLGDFKKSVPFVPIDFKKLWYVTQGRELISIDEVTPENENRKFEEGPIKNTRAIVFYGLVGDNPLPYTISFKGTSYVAGKTLLTQAWVMGNMLGKKPWAHSFDIGSKKKENDQGTFAVLTVKEGKETSKETATKAQSWLAVIENAKPPKPLEEKGKEKNFSEDDIPF